MSCKLAGMGSVLSVTVFGDVDVAARAWKFRGRTFLTAIVKATYEIVPDGTMKLVTPTDVVPVDRPRPSYSSALSSVARSSDTALFLSTPEVLLDAEAFAAPGQSVTSTTVRVLLQRTDPAPGRTVLDKRLDIVGDRRGPLQADPPTPAAFRSMPIIYERAFGGPSHPDNPVGVGMVASEDGMATFPNILPPRSSTASDPLGDATLRPRDSGLQFLPVTPGFGPLSAVWPIRRKRVRPEILERLNDDVVVLPDDFDGGYFQSAPLDQYVDKLVGGELLTLLNLHPELPSIRTFLPMTRAIALGQTPGGDRIPLPVRLDTIHVVPHALRAELVFRGATSLRQLEGFHVAGALENPGENTEFPDLRAAPASIPPPFAGNVNLAAKAHPLSGTMSPLAQPSTPSLPFARSSKIPEPRPNVPAPRNPLEATPWDKGTKEAQAAKPVAHPLTATIALPQRFPSKTLVVELPDAAPPPVASSPEPSPAPPEPPPPAPVPPVPPAAPEPPRPPPPPPEPPVKEAPKKSPWREDPEAPAPAPAPVAPKPKAQVQQRENVRSQLYKKK